MQNHLNLLNREEEREMLPLCLDQGIGLLPWSPLARGKLTRPWDQTTERAQTDVFGKTLYGTNESDPQIVARVLDLAQRRNVPPAQVALAWVAQKPGVTAPIIGASKPHHLTDAVSGLELKLTPAEVKELEQPYMPHAIAGFQ
jgi:aryl-alcohol dehydrogenase-like predicted oxidoreductase